MKSPFIALCAIVSISAHAYAAGLARGDVVKLKRGETLMLNGKKFQQAAKGQEFSVVKTDLANVYVFYTNGDGSEVAPAIPADSVEPVAPDGWTDIVSGTEAFREGRWDDARRLLGRAAMDAQQKALAGALLTRIQGALTAGNTLRSLAADPGRAAVAQKAFATTVQTLRDSAKQVQAAGKITIGVALDEGTDKLAAAVLGANAAGIPASIIDRASLGERAAVLRRSLARARQSIGQHKLVEAGTIIEEGLKAEPGRAELVAFQAKVKKDMEEADYLHKTAASMRDRGPKGVIHALSALEDGLKLCSDHPQLRVLRQQMQAQYEERTSPPVNAAFMAKAKNPGGEKALNEGRELYVNRCTECHDLEMLSSRGYSGWEKSVGGMARRAGLDGGEQAKIMAYIAAALNVVEE
jgi:hypothetical protein